MRKFIRINKSSTDGADEGDIVIPISSFRGAFPTSDTVLTLFFVPVTTGTAESGQDNIRVLLTITTNKHKDVIEAIIKEFSTEENYMIILADNETSTFLHSDITAVDWELSSQINYDTVGWNGHRSLIKILPSDFVPDDGGRPVMINDASIGSDELFLFSHDTKDMFATIAIPSGFKATQVRIYGSDTGQNFYVYHADINDKDITDIGTGATAIESTCTLATPLTASNTNYMIIRVTSDGDSDEIHGGEITMIPNV